MLVVTSDNVSLFALKLGEGRPIVMIHGLLFGNLTTWWYTVAPELARQHRVILYDLRGHGRSERVPSGYDAVTMASDLISVIEEVAREPAVVVGHSFGGAIALEAALDRPELVAKVVVVEAPLPPALPDLASFVPESKEAVMAMIPERLHGTAAAMARSPRRERRFAE